MINREELFYDDGENDITVKKENGKYIYTINYDDAEYTINPEEETITMYHGKKTATLLARYFADIMADYVSRKGKGN